MNLASGIVSGVLTPKGASPVSLTIFFTLAAISAPFSNSSSEIDLLPSKLS